MFWSAEHPPARRSPARCRSRPSAALLRPWPAPSQQNPPRAELPTVLQALVQQQPQWLPLLQQWPAVLEQARVRSLVPGPETALALPQGYCWFASSGRPLAEAWVEQPLEPLSAGSPWLRLIGLPDPLSQSLYAETPGDINLDPLPLEPEVLGPGEYSLSPEAPAPKAPGARQDYISLRRASGPRVCVVCGARCSWCASGACGLVRLACCRGYKGLAVARRHCGTAHAAAQRRVWLHGPAVVAPCACAPRHTAATCGSGRRRWRAPSQAV